MEIQTQIFSPITAVWHRDREICFCSMIFISKIVSSMNSNHHAPQCTHTTSFSIWVHVRVHSLCGGREQEETMFHRNTHTQTSALKVAVKYLWEKLHWTKWRAKEKTSPEHSPSCCSVVAFTCAGRFSVCNRLSYASFAALYFFCQQNEKRRTTKRERERQRGCLSQTGG